MYKFHKAERATTPHISKLPKIAEKIDKFHAKMLYPILILIYVKANFSV